MSKYLDSVLVVNWGEISKAWSDSGEVIFDKHSEDSRIPILKATRHKQKSKCLMWPSDHHCWAVDQQGTILIFL